jgi:hypothetical protein
MPIAQLGYPFGARAGSQAGGDTEIAASTKEPQSSSAFSSSPAQPKVAERAGTPFCTFVMVSHLHLRRGPPGGGLAADR